MKPFNKLSTCGLEIAMLINKGKSLPQICTDLNIQYSTANTYKRRIFEKLSVYSTLTLSRLMSSFKIEDK
ncbi:LuxR C-terminal-related transcriptional regulator [Pinibacter aurantiacus]|uniref:LuxR C-terminal-related transcriptional regulator n=1 Tax=Pinibacter aurantiacus TaxID=2851599 RepID=A0A9E2W599_9BACT|nr:LuxR C-terminal-related transcriptional regulator [Pinibacter aurantiacus]